MTDTLTFALSAAALIGVALAFLLPALLRSRMRPDGASRAKMNAAIYHQQIDELEGEVARGAIASDDAEKARIELHRRLLEDTEQETATAAPARRQRAAAIAVALLVPFAAGAIYFAVGQPAALTPAEASATGEEADYVERLQAHLVRQPRDARAWVLLARAQADRDQFRDAAESYEKALTAPAGKASKDPGVLCEYADVLGVMQGGRLDGRPLELVYQALSINPKHPVALEMAGSAAYADGRYGESARYWRLVLDQLAPGTEQHRQLSAAIDRAQRRAAVSLPPAPRQ
jgi:cytochrome c-type biogenesis protein CcmH